MGFSRLPWWLSDKESTCNARDRGSVPGLGRSASRHGNPPVFLPEKSHGQSILVNYSPWGCKESDTTEATQYACMHGLPWWFSHKESSCSIGDLILVGMIPWRRKWQPTPVFLSGKSHGQRILAGYSPRGGQRVGDDLVTKQQQCEGLGMGEKQVQVAEESYSDTFKSTQGTIL